MGREDRIRELREELARLEAEEKAPQPWSVLEEEKADEYWFANGVFTLQLTGDVELVMARRYYSKENARLRKLMYGLSLFPLMVEALRRHADEDRDAAYLLHQIEGEGE